jgi:hypothetical protein
VADIEAFSSTAVVRVTHSGRPSPSSDEESAWTEGEGDRLLARCELLWDGRDEA